MKKKMKWVILVVVLIFAYELLGAIVPFVHPKRVEGSFRR